MPRIVSGLPGPFAMLRSVTTEHSLDGLRRYPGGVGKAVPLGQPGTTRALARLAALTMLGRRAVVQRVVLSIVDA